MPSIFGCFSNNNSKSASSSVNHDNEKYVYEIPERKSMNRGSFGELSVLVGKFKKKFSASSSSNATKVISGENEKNEEIDGFLDSKEYGNDARPIKVKFNYLSTRVFFETKKIEVNERVKVDEKIMRKLENKPPLILTESEKKELDAANKLNYQRAVKIINYIKEVHASLIKDGYNENEIILKVNNSLYTENQKVLKIKAYYFPPSEQQKQEVSDAQGFFLDVLKDFNVKINKDFEKILSMVSINVKDYVNYINNIPSVENNKCIVGRDVIEEDIPFLSEQGAKNWYEKNSINNDQVIRSMNATQTLQEDSNAKENPCSAEDAEVAAVFQKSQNKNPIKDVAMDGKDLDDTVFDELHEYINNYK